VNIHETSSASFIDRSKNKSALNFSVSRNDIIGMTTMDSMDKFSYNRNDISYENLNSLAASPFKGSQSVMFTRDGGTGSAYNDKVNNTLALE
jgi:hypothetical protein